MLNFKLDILSGAMILFIILELANIMILYYKPDSKLGNGVAVFNSFEKSKENAHMYQFVKYMVNWVAGTKLIFIALLIVILLTGNELTKILSAVGLVLSIATFYWKLYPIIKKLDEMNEITPKGYSKTLNHMIFGFIVMFIIALILYIVSLIR